MKREVTDLRSQYKYFIDGKQTSIDYQWLKNLEENVYELWSTYSYLYGDLVSSGMKPIALNRLA